MLQLTANFILTDIFKNVGIYWVPGWWSLWLLACLYLGVFRHLSMIKPSSALLGIIESYPTFIRELVSKPIMVPGGTRTVDLRIASPSAYPTEPRPRLDSARRVMVYGLWTVPNKIKNN